MSDTLVYYLGEDLLLLLRIVAEADFRRPRPPGLAHSEAG